MAEQVTTAVERVGKAEPKGTSLWHSLVLIVAGGVVTTGGGTLLTSYIAEQQRMNQKLAERAEMRAESGVELEKRILGQTGAILGELRRQRDDLRKENAPEERLARAEQRASGSLEMAWLGWRSGVHALRNETGRVFNIATADRVYQPANKRFAVDQCNVVTSFNDKQYDRNCAARTNREQQEFTRLMRELNDGADFNAIRSEVIIPMDFDTSVSVAKVMLERLLKCRLDIARRKASGEDGVADGRPPLESFIRACNEVAKVASMRVNLAGNVHESIADSMLRLWNNEPSEGGEGMISRP